MNKQQIKEIIKLAITQAGLTKQGQGEAMFMVEDLIPKQSKQPAQPKQSAQPKQPVQPKQPARPKQSKQTLEEVVQEIIQAAGKKKIIPPVITPEQAIRPIYGSRWNEAVISAQKRMKEHPLTEYGFYPWTEENLQQNIPVGANTALGSLFRGTYMRPKLPNRGDYILLGVPKSKSLARKYQGNLPSNLRSVLLHEITHAYTEPRKHTPLAYTSHIDEDINRIRTESKHIAGRAKNLAARKPSPAKETLKDVSRDPEYYINSLELDPRLAQIKRFYFQETGKLVKTPEEAEEMFNWATNEIFTNPKKWADKRNSDAAEIWAIYTSLPEKFKRILRERATQLVANRKPEKAKGLV